MGVQSAPYISGDTADGMPLCRSIDEDEAISTPPTKDRKPRVYMDFYELREAPFTITPDPEFLYLSYTHQNVIEKLLYGIDVMMGIMLLTGEVGTGKTTICRSLLDRLEGKAETVYIINPSFTGKELIACILDDLSISYSPDATKKDLVKQLNAYLLSIADSKSLVIIVDDAQTMPLNALEDLRLLSNLETDKNKLIQMILVGQPELEANISRPDMRQLEQRVSIKCCLDNLKKEEVDPYVSRRLYIAGEKGHVRFTAGAIKKIYNASKGIPRIINTICDYALTAGFVGNQMEIGTPQVMAALKELGEGGFSKRSLSINIFWKKRFRLKRLAYVPIFSILLLMAFFLNSYIKNNFFISQNPKSEAVTESGLDLSFLDPRPLFNSIKPQSSGKIDANNGISGEYALRLGSFKTLERVKRAVSVYDARGIEAHWHKVDLGEKGTWYGLFSGRFETKEAAARFKADRRIEESDIVWVPWTVQIKTARALSDLTKYASYLKENQYDSYAVKDESGRYKLLCGTFVTKPAAEELAQEIRSLYLSANVVPR